MVNTCILLESLCLLDPSITCQKHGMPLLLMFALWNIRYASPSFQLHLLSASVSDADVVCANGPAHQIMIALGWCDAHMPVLDGLQTRFFEASLGNVAANCFAPMVVSLQFVKECCASRTESLSQEDALQGNHSDEWMGRVPSFPIPELCFSRETSMLEHITHHTAAALEAVKHEHVISGFVLDWFNRGALHRNSDLKLWLVQYFVDSQMCILSNNSAIRSALLNSTTTQIHLCFLTALTRCHFGCCPLLPLP